MGDDRTARVNWVKKALSAFKNRPLTEAESSLIDQFLQGKTIKNAAKDSGYSQSHAKRVSADIGEAIALATGELEPINKSSWLPKIPDDLRQQPEPDFAAGEGAIAHPSIPNQNFVGREGAIAHLNTHINQGAKIIVIKASGGIGKTTLAQQYLKSQVFDLVLDIPMAKETENITAVENVIEEWLKRDFDEEPGREFGVMLGRLKRQLQTRKVGVLIDNLEPALDGQGRFIQPHRRYIDLLRILADSTVLSVTLITSRHRLCDPEVSVDHYELPGLDQSAWQQFFGSGNIDIDIPTLNAMHNTYGGNAKAMGILCGAIREDFDGNMVAYWRENSADPLVKTDLNNLVTTQFQRLQELDPAAYKLLCRLGCYRYQDVPTVPTEGMLCLLWDVPAPHRRRVIESLRNRSLVEGGKAEYWLHPMIREEAIARLKESGDWEKANNKIAEYWTGSIQTIETLEDAGRALEAYHHYLEIKNFDLAGHVITKMRSNRWEDEEPLGRYCYRLGLLQQSIYLIISIIDKISPGYVLSRLYNILGDLYWLTGNIKNGINCHEISGAVAKRTIENFDIQSSSEQVFFWLKRLVRYSIFNIVLCKIDLLELEEASVLLDNSLSTLNQNCTYENGFYESESEPIIYWCCVAFVISCREGGNNEKAYKLAERAYNLRSINKLDTWGKGYTLLFLGMTYRNLCKFKKSFDIYCKAINYAEESHYTQVKAKALSGMAELYREQGEFETALSHHSESIDILEKIAAKCDLAEAYYQFALTYQKMGQCDQSQEYFDKAIQIFNKMEAPKQVEKVRKAIGKSDEV